MQTTEERVANGVLLLDTEHQGWYAEIKLDRLDMRIGSPPSWPGAEKAGCGCILTQLYGNYHAGCVELGINSFEAEEHGFEAQAVPTWEDYDALQDLWEDLIAKRQDA